MSKISIAFSKVSQPIFINITYLLFFEWYQCNIENIVDFGKKIFEILKNRKTLALSHIVSIFNAICIKRAMFLLFEKYQRSKLF